MNCPTCGAATSVTNSRPVKGVPRAVRRRQHKCPNGHRFETIETFVVPNLQYFAIRRSGDGRLSEHNFTEHELRESLHHILFAGKGQLSAPEVDLVATHVVRRLEAEIEGLDLRLLPDEYESRHDLVGAIPDTLIADVVSEQLRSTMGRWYRVAGVLYAMAIYGRNDRRGRRGWSDARAVLAWIGDAYPNLTLNVPARQAARPDADPNPNLADPAPEWVIKRVGSPSRFDYRRFRTGILRTMYGRQHAAAASHMVAHTVLRNLRGQVRVTSGQLSSEAMAVLRQVDDLAYLRWSIIAKRLDSIEQIAQEAVALIEHPSPRLRLQRVWVDRERSGELDERIERQSDSEDASDE